MFTLTQLAFKAKFHDLTPSLRELFKIHIFTDAFFIENKEYYFNVIAQLLKINVEFSDYEKNGMSFFYNRYDGLAYYYTEIGRAHV